MSYGQAPEIISEVDVHLTEFMHYQYLPVTMRNVDVWSYLKLPKNLESIRPLIIKAMIDNYNHTDKNTTYVYVTAKKGIATPGNPLNRPGWHTDGFGTDDINYIWYRGPKTQFAVQKFYDISTDHNVSMKQFDDQIVSQHVGSPMGDATLLRLNPFVVHCTPDINEPVLREFVKISFSNEKYNLIDNSHNYLFDYDWQMLPRESVRNHPAKVMRDYS